MSDEELKREVMYILYKYRCHDCDHHGDDGWCDSSCDYKWDVLDKIEEIFKTVCRAEPTVRGSK